jgi:hypothetical protein
MIYLFLNDKSQACEYHYYGRGPRQNEALMLAFELGENRSTTTSNPVALQARQLAVTVFQTSAMRA